MTPSELLFVAYAAFLVWLLLVRPIAPPRPHPFLARVLSEEEERRIRRLRAVHERARDPVGARELAQAHARELAYHRARAHARELAHARAQERER